MNIQFEIIIIIVSFLILLSVLVSKVAERYGVPILLLFLGIGMLAGSEGLGGIYFDDPSLTQNVSIAALVMILFSGGLDTSWKSIKTVAVEGALLATIGVALTASIFGLFVYFILKLSLAESLLIGAIISSTDAAAVFAILRSKGVNLKGSLSPLLELESGSNDPMAILLTITLISFVTKENTSILGSAGLLVLQLAIGFAVGWIMSKITLFLINKLKLGYEGLYQILIMALLFLVYSLTTLVKGSGFLAVYVMAIFMGKEDFLHKRSVLRFFDSTAWISQIVLFLTLGLLVFPSRLTGVILPGLGLAFALIFIARPVSVFLTLSPFKLSLREKLFISWVGLRGAVPIVLATYPLVARITHADMIFNVVFFVVVISVTLQGTLLPKVAKWLKVESKNPPKPKPPLEIVAGELIPSELSEIVIPECSNARGKAIYELNLPAEYLIVLISRDGAYLQPRGTTIIQANDRLIALCEKNALQDAKKILCSPEFEQQNCVE